ncbi:hypothetical protein [Rikenella microfusus]|uniref:Uncharacterized protein n=1 Tax=Rikenella microfusus TaxID=28139 RepID=A0A379MTF9_9BACT|nr:hypothetical protein [Rikenella microfusus]SUE34835.1 Uncharacterised protein [Rikenella microfusus]
MKADPTDYIAYYEVISDLRYVCQLAEMLLFPKSELVESTDESEPSQHTIFHEINLVLCNHTFVDAPSEFWFLNHEKNSVENIYMQISDPTLRKIFVQEVNLRLEGLTSTLERLASVGENRLREVFTELSLKYDYRGVYNLGYLVYNAIEEAVTLLETMHRLSPIKEPAKPVKASSDAKLEEWFPKDAEKWIRFIEEQLKLHTRKQGQFVALLLYSLEQTKKMETAWQNTDRRKTLAGLQRVLCSRFPDKIASEQAIQKYLAPTYNSKSNSQYILDKKDISDMIKKIQKFK